MQTDQTRPRAGQAALVARIPGDPARFDERTLETVWRMSLESPTRQGFAGLHVLLADADAGTVMVMVLFESREQVTAIYDDIRTGLEVTSVIVGGDPAAASFEVLDVVGAAWEPHHYGSAS
jgi:hypothetical protein